MAPHAVRVKICGLTRPEDARAAAEAGADAIGLNFVAGPRKIDLRGAETILGALPDTLQAWALFDVGGPELPQMLHRLAADGCVSHVQMYGRATSDAIARLHGAGLQAVAVRHVTSAAFVPETRSWLRQCRSDQPDLLLLDAGGAELPGGTGCTLNWKMLAEQRAAGQMNDWPPIVLAGGLTPENVAQAVRTVTPAWVDVSSGVEESPGLKEPAKVRAFIRAAGSALR